MNKALFLLLLLLLLYSFFPFGLVQYFVCVLPSRPRGRLAVELPPFFCVCSLTVIIDPRRSHRRRSLQQQLGNDGGDGGGRDQSIFQTEKDPIVKTISGEKGGNTQQRKMMGQSHPPVARRRTDVSSSSSFRRHSGDKRSLSFRFLLIILMRW